MCMYLHIYIYTGMKISGMISRSRELVNSMNEYHKIIIFKIN